MLGDDDEMNIFSRYNKGAPSAGKGSAKFVTKEDQVQKITIENHSDVQTFGARNGEGKVEKSPLSEGVTGPRQEYSSFKQSAKYNKYAKEGQPQKQPAGPKDVIGLDIHARNILKNDDLGEVAEWGAMSLNQKKMASGLDQDDDGGFGYPGKAAAPAQQDDDEFDFDDGPAVAKVAVTADDGNMEALRQKALKKLENPGMKIGGGLASGGLANRLANKQRELNEKSKESELPKSGFAAQQTQGTNSQPTFTTNTGSGKVELGNSFGPRPTQEFTAFHSNSTEGVTTQQNSMKEFTHSRPLLAAQANPLPPAQKMISFGQDEDEWNQVNAEQRKLGVVSVQPYQEVESKDWEVAWNTLRVEDYSKFKNDIVVEESKSFFQKVFGCFAPGLEQSRKKEKEIVYSLAKVTFDSQSRLHQGLLQGIYKHFYPQGDCPSTGVHWRKIGFQSEDPNRDFRSTGVLGPLQVASFIHRHPEWAKEIHLWSLDDRHNFPFIVNQFSLSKLSLELFRLAKLNSLANKRPGFMIAFDDLYCAATVLFFARYQTEGHTVATFGTLQQRIEEEIKADPNRIVDKYLSSRLELTVPIAKILTAGI